jgi:hypothetical protein
MYWNQHNFAKFTLAEISAKLLESYQFVDPKEFSDNYFTEQMFFLANYFLFYFHPMWFGVQGTVKIV